MLYKQFLLLVQNSVSYLLLVLQVQVSLGMLTLDKEPDQFSSMTCYVQGQRINWLTVGMMVLANTISAHMLMMLGSGVSHVRQPFWHSWLMNLIGMCLDFLQARVIMETSG